MAHEIFVEIRMLTTLKIATKQDSEEIANLVNRAYRPKSTEFGWTHEAQLVAGNRVTPGQLEKLFDGDSTILTLLQGEFIVSCVTIEVEDSVAYIGMLATEPRLQATGLGKSMMKHAEHFAGRVLGASKFKISVLSARRELIDFYERRGYVRTGETQNYPASAGVGKPLIKNLGIETLVKPAPP
jgi:ribosomal protein S18 acetylase RimI-like enzyme